MYIPLPSDLPISKSCNFQRIVGFFVTCGGKNGDGDLFLSVYDAFEWCEVFSDCDIGDAELEFDFDEWCVEEWWEDVDEWLFSFLLLLLFICDGLLKLKFGDGLFDFDAVR